MRFLEFKCPLLYEIMKATLFNTIISQKFPVGSVFLVKSSIAMVVSSLIKFPDKAMSFFLFLIFRMMMVLAWAILEVHITLSRSFYLPLAIAKVSKDWWCYFNRQVKILYNCAEFYRLFLIWLFYAKKGYVEYQNNIIWTGYTKSLSSTIVLYIYSVCMLSISYLNFHDPQFMDNLLENSLENTYIINNP